MHRDIVTNSIVKYIRIVYASNKIDSIITGSNDGHIKIWKKAYVSIEFLKHFRAHTGNFKIIKQILLKILNKNRLSNKFNVFTKRICCKMIF
jgi:hypothetical protein